MKGKDMILSNFLSRQITDNSNHHMIIPISFDTQAILKDRYYNVGSDNKYLIQTHSQAKASGIKLPEVHSVDKGIDPNIKPERQMLKSPDPAILSNKLRLAEHRAGPGRKISVSTQMQMQVELKNKNQTKEQTLSKQREGIQAPLTKQTTVRHIKQRPEIDIMPEHTIRPKVTETQISNYLDPLRKPPPRPLGI